MHTHTHTAPHLLGSGDVQHCLHTLGALGVQGHGQHIVEGELREVQLTLLHQQLNGRLLSLRHVSMLVDAELSEATLARSPPATLPLLLF
eukprot:1151493-Pelagomonas_calceolata.AAC.7